MSAQWRILVVEDEEELNRNTVNSLRRDDYLVQGVASVAEAMRVLWSEEYDIVICDLKRPGAEGFELLQWLRAYRPDTRMIMVAAPGSASVRTQALEAGAVSYLEKPLDLHVLKEELRRLLQQTGFSADLDSFDLLDVVQIINMSRKSIAMLVNTGLEERGILRFQEGELIWAEYGSLRGEAAFFALAAHKNGTVIHQPWNEQIVPNVMQPLSRLIFQALQYRTKYATFGEANGEGDVGNIAQRSPLADEDDSPFLVLADPNPEVDSAVVATSYEQSQDGAREWWQQTGNTPRLNGGGTGSGSITGTMPDTPINSPAVHGRSVASSGSDIGSVNINVSTVRKTPASQRTDLPSWLTDRPTKSDMAALRPSSLSNTGRVPATPVPKSSPAEWQAPAPPAKTTEPVFPNSNQGTGAQRIVAREVGRGAGDVAPRKTSSPEWQPPEDGSQPQSPRPTSGPLQSLILARQTGDTPASNNRQESGPLSNPTPGGTPIPHRPARRDYRALVAALQTLGYSVPGFIATAVVMLDGQPIAQVAVDDLDISPMCGYFSNILQGALLSLERGGWGNYEDTVITSADRQVLLRFVGTEKRAFQVLVTTREADPVESLEVMANVEGAIAAAL